MYVHNKIPVDMVANAMIATAAEHFHDSGSHTVYHVASSYRNPIIFKQIAELMIRYFKKSPLVGRSGVPIVPRPPVLLSTMTMFRLYTGLHFKIPLKVDFSLRVLFKLKCIISHFLGFFFRFFRYWDYLANFCHRNLEIYINVKTVNSR